MSPLIAHFTENVLSKGICQSDFKVKRKVILNSLISKQLSLRSSAQIRSGTLLAKFKIPFRIHSLQLPYV